jgi:ferredoxin
MKLMLVISAFLFYAFPFYSQGQCNQNCRNPEKCIQTNQIKQAKTDSDIELDSPSGSEEDEFEEFNPAELDTAALEVASDEAPAEAASENQGIIPFLIVPLIGLALTLLSGIALRFSPSRRLKPVFLVGGIIYFGFVVGACPCPISSFSHVIIGITGGETNWLHTVWFLGLIPLTYVFGKTWCGWVCHLGCLQEFLYRKNKFKFLQGKRSQIIMKWLRYFFTILLVVQLITMHEYVFNKFDPFRVIYNLGFGADTLSWILVGLLILTSLFIHRPFCKAACPIGLVLGLVQRIPGASVIGSKESCIGCASGYKSCNYDAIKRVEEQFILDNTECISCGECFENCSKNGLQFRRKSKANPVKPVVCSK